MTWTRATVVLALVIYVGLWALALAGATSLVAPLLIPLVLAGLVATGVGLNRYLGLPVRARPPREPGPDEDVRGRT